MNDDIVLSSTLPFSADSPRFIFLTCSTTCLFILAYAYCVMTIAVRYIFMFDSINISSSLATTDSRF